MSSIDFSTVKSVTIPAGDVKKIEIDGVTVWEKSTSILPSAYQQVEWIEGTKNQRLQIPVPSISDNETFTAVLDSQTVSILSGTNVFISATALAGAGTWMGIVDSQMTIGLENYFSTAPTTRCTKTIVFSNAQITATIGEETYSRATTSITPETTLKIFRANNYYSDTKVYSLKVYDNSNTLIRDLVPCYRISDNVIGMYDTVSGTFYTNTGTGTFTKGLPVNYPVGTYITDNLTWVTGQYVNGELDTDSTTFLCCEEYIPVSEAYEYTRTYRLYQCMYYDSNKNVIGTYSINNLSTSVLPNVAGMAYIRVATHTTYKNILERNSHTQCFYIQRTA